MSIGDKQIDPAVVIVIEKLRTPAHVRQTRRRDLSRVRKIGKRIRAVVTVQRVVLVGEVGNEEIDLSVVPGLTAMLAVAAKVGAPLGHDFCAISLSNNLKPWDIIEKRLIAAAEAGFVMAFYNPISKARPWQLGRAFEALSAILPGTTPVIFGRAAGRPDERIEVASLAFARADMADMATCVIIGSPETRVIKRNGKPALVYTPRSATGRRE